MSAVLFDLDCTLTDRPASIRRFAQVFLDSFATELRAIDPATVIELITAADDCGYAPRSAVCEALVKRLDWNGPPELSQLVEYWKKHFPECTAPRDGIRETLPALRENGAKLAIVSNGNTQTQRRKIQVLGIGDLLDAILISDEVGCRKPGGEIFKLALARIGSDAASAWFVGDHPKNDIEGARQSGLKTVWLKGVHAWPQELAPADRSIEHFNELLSVLYG